MSAAIRLAVVGLGKIAHDRHLPAIAESPEFELTAAASPVGAVPGIPHFRTVDALLDSGVAIDAVALCQPPQFRYEAAARAIRAGKHVLLEKSPGASSLEVDHLVELAASAGTTLFAAWHSRYAPGVEPARAWLARARIRSVDIRWCEDVRHWHPGQAWIWEPGGLGVFDPGINALSILTYLLPEPLRVMDGTLHVPDNRHAPIAAELHLRTLTDVPVHAVFDWRQTGTQTWEIAFETDRGPLRLSHGGRLLQTGAEATLPALDREYPEIYTRFATLIRAGRSDVDVAPLRLVADTFVRCRWNRVEPFHET